MFFTGLLVAVSLVGVLVLTGVDVSLDPRDPDVMVASTWQRHRHVWGYIAGGPESALHRSTDGGKTWRKLGGVPVVLRRNAQARRMTMRLAPDGSEVRITLPRWGRSAEALAATGALGQRVLALAMKTVDHGQRAFRARRPHLHAHRRAAGPTRTGG